MTVCIATICADGIVFGASDRMITSGDVEFEPPAEKLYPLTSSIMAMTAGDSSLQTEILAMLYNEVAVRIKADPQRWIKVKELAEAYATAYTEIKKTRAGLAVLGPLGLDTASFISKQKLMDAGFIRDLTSEILNFDLPDVEVIIAGVDTDGPHIYVVRGNDISCYDAVGFAAVGIGARHAESQLMLAGHSRKAEIPESILLTYLAKKRSEIAPGVGKETDLFTVGPDLGTLVRLTDPFLLDGLQKICDEIEQEETNCIKTAKNKIGACIDELVTRNAKKSQELEKVDGKPAPADGKSLKEPPPPGEKS